MPDQLLDRYLEERFYGPMRADGWPGFDNPEDEQRAREIVEKSLVFQVYKMTRTADDIFITLSLLIIATLVVIAVYEWVF